MDRVVFACRHNAGRSQMAAAFFARAADAGRAQAVSAGTTPAERVHPEVAQVMAERGLDLASALGNNPVDFGREDAVRVLRRLT